MTSQCGHVTVDWLVIAAALGCVGVILRRKVGAGYRLISVLGALSPPWLAQINLGVWGEGYITPTRKWGTAG